MQRLLRRKLLVLALLAASPAAAAQAGEEAELRARYAEKLKKEFVGKIPWEQSFEQARAKAKAEGKPVLAYFTRSYAP